MTDSTHKAEVKAEAKAETALAEDGTILTSHFPLLSHISLSISPLSFPPSIPHLTEFVDLVVTPWEVSSTGGIDYAKLITKFGSSAIDQALIAR